MKTIRFILKAIIFIGMCMCILIGLFAALSFIKFGIEKLIS